MEKIRLKYSMAFSKNMLDDTEAEDVVRHIIGDKVIKYINIVKKNNKKGTTVTGSLFILLPDKEKPF